MSSISVYVRSFNAKTVLFKKNSVQHKYAVEMQKNKKNKKEQ